MQVACCGFEGREPPGDTPLTMAWLTETGDPSGVVLADVHLEHPDDGTTVVVRSTPDGGEQRWTVTESFAGRDMPPVVATDDGGALLLFYDPILMPDTPAVLYDFRPDGSVDTFQVGPYRYAAAMHSSRFIITFNDGYLKLALP